MLTVRLPISFDLSQIFLYIGPKSDHCLALSVRQSVTAFVEFCSDGSCGPDGPGDSRGSGGLGGSAWLGGSGWYGVPSWASSRYFKLFDLIQKYFQMETLSLMIQKNLMIPKSPIV